MDIAWFPNNIAHNGHPVMAAMITALQARGHCMIADTLTADAAVIWSMLWAGRMRGNREIFQHYRAIDRPVIVIEVGCLQRGILWKVGVNGTLPRPCLAAAGGPGRASLLGMKMRPWRKDRGEAVMLCLQRTQSQQWQTMPSVEEWIKEILDQVRVHTDRPIIVRPHPRQRLRDIPSHWHVQLPLHQSGTYDDFDFDRSLDAAWAVINFNSHPGIQSVIQGVPAFVDATSLAAPVANLDLSKINDPAMPDRESWFEDLAWTEFSVEEIRRGVPLDRLCLS